MKKILVIIGPTAVGKTALSVSIASQISGVILSADSIQVYKGLDIISGKDLDTLKNTPYFLIDVVSPNHPFSVSDYLREFENVLGPLNKNPIIVGGTGFYVLSLLEGIGTVDIKPDKSLREKLGVLSVIELQELLGKENPEKLEEMNNSDRNNPRRLVRAIEVANAKNMEHGMLHVEKNLLNGYEVKVIGLELNREKLNQRIDKRVDERLEQGALEEAKLLFEEYNLLAPQIKQANGYKQLFAYLKGEINLNNAIENWKTAEHQNAKKQMTFFKKIKNVTWFDVEIAGSDKILKYIREWYNE
ncbi:MAG: tRNA (adenosine(37)-N6)-dimethylallyltransferase MiaA [Candidatus Levyibacteriota bacterium]